MRSPLGIWSVNLLQVTRRQSSNIPCRQVAFLAPVPGRPGSPDENLCNAPGAGLRGPAPGGGAQAPAAILRFARPAMKYMIT